MSWTKKVEVGVVCVVRLLVFLNVTEPAIVAKEVDASILGQALPEGWKAPLAKADVQPFLFEGMVSQLVWAAESAKGSFIFVTLARQPAASGARSASELGAFLTEEAFAIFQPSQFSVQSRDIAVGEGVRAGMVEVQFRSEAPPYRLRGPGQAMKVRKVYLPLVLRGEEGYEAATFIFNYRGAPANAPDEAAFESLLKSAGKLELGELLSPEEYSAARRLLEGKGIPAKGDGFTGAERAESARAAISSGESEPGGGALLEALLAGDKMSAASEEFLKGVEGSLGDTVVGEFARLALQRSRAERAKQLLRSLLAATERESAENQVKVAVAILISASKVGDGGAVRWVVEWAELRKLHLVTSEADLLAQLLARDILSAASVEAADHSGLGSPFGFEDSDHSRVVAALRQRHEELRRLVEVAEQESGGGWRMKAGSPIPGPVLDRDGKVGCLVPGSRAGSRVSFLKVTSLLNVYCSPK